MIYHSLVARRTGPATLDLAVRNLIRLRSGRRPKGKALFRAFPFFDKELTLWTPRMAKDRLPESNGHPRDPELNPGTRVDSNVLGTTPESLASEGSEPVEVSLSHASHTIETDCPICPPEVSSNMSRHDGTCHGAPSGLLERVQIFQRSPNHCNLRPPLPA
jgi:hypothetical protein